MAVQPSQRFVSLIVRDTLALVLAGGKGTRLGALTMNRVKPAVPFGGRFRIVDFALSNCINSGIRRIGVLTQYKAHSLIQHIQQGWNSFRAEFGEYVELLPAQQRVGEAWYAGTADAVRQNTDIIRGHDPRFVLILGGDHVYKMDYGALLGFHVSRGADITVGCIPVPLEQAHAFGVMQVDAGGRVLEFVEKPTHPAPMPDAPGLALASMGIYVFNAAFLLQRLAADAEDAESSHDFGHDIVPRALRDCAVYGYPFHDPATGRPAYWRDVGDVDSYWRANLELLDVVPELNLYDRDWPIWTLQEQTPPAKFVLDEPGRCGVAISSMVAGGCVVSGATVRHSMLFSSVFVDEGSLVEDSILLPGVHVGKHCRVRRAILDAHCVLPDHATIGYDAADQARYEVSAGGVAVVTPGMLAEQCDGG
ncbi:MAG: glucose-1-phosphate adenylyltransferase [Mizugakiibacter sp.]|uniref:glucose-1-phosphate adenylyltransferase n=1 Tax=Mizugakiibacter sp. TaxID=1972610 RepID=UPI0031C2C9D0|nr:glucose-1-phosphate adenylyltransferase [Xanthomonadaceae bacterium]